MKRFYMVAIIMALFCVILSGCAERSDGHTSNETIDENYPLEDQFLLYEEYEALSGSEQKKYFETVFNSNFESFFEWLDMAIADYEARNPSVEVGTGGIIDIFGDD